MSVSVNDQYIHNIVLSSLRSRARRSLVSSSKPRKPTPCFLSTRRKSSGMNTARSSGRLSSACSCFLSVLLSLLVHRGLIRVLAIDDGSSGVNRRSKYVTQIQQQRPSSTTMTLTWHACKYRVHKLHQRCILVLVLRISSAD